VVGATESIRDITGRRLMEKSLEGYRHRLRVKSGLGKFHDREILELLLTYAIPPGKDVKAIARGLLNEFENNLASTLDAPAEALQRVEGVGERTAELIGLIPRLFASYLSSRWMHHETFNSTEATVSYIRALIGTKRREVFCVLVLDSQNGLIAVEQVQKGSVNRIAVLPRQVVEASLKHHASAVILAHNHPGGDPSPSAADRQLTSKLKTILADLDILVHDHIIVAGHDKYYSFAQIGDLAWAQGDPTRSWCRIESGKSLPASWALGERAS
jgi:DNA repair protein RadC